jgi:two-component system, chemotaxis family, response regulator Rcp1
MRSEVASRPVEILLVEDNPGDARLTREAFGACRRPSRLTVVDDGAKAMAYLRGHGEYAAATRPDLVLLDLNLPRHSGHEVLAEIKSDPTLCSIPVVVMTTSTAAEDVKRAYAAHANCYLAKPVDFDRFVAVVASIEAFWLDAVVLPTRDGFR